MDVSAFQQLIARVTEEIDGIPLGSALESHLNAQHGAGSRRCDRIHAACLHEENQQAEMADGGNAAYAEKTDELSEQARHSA